MKIALTLSTPGHLVYTVVNITLEQCQRFRVLQNDVEELKHWYTDLSDFELLDDTAEYGTQLNLDSGFMEEIHKKGWAKIPDDYQWPEYCRQQVYNAVVVVSTHGVCWRATSPYDRKRYETATIPFNG